MFVPASGNANDGSMHNVGENGNLWSSSLLESDSKQAFNFGFNAPNGMGGVASDDNRYNGYPVRGVLPKHFIFYKIKSYILIFIMILTKESLLFDLYVAYEDAIRHKKKKEYVKNFEQNLHKNLCELRDSLYNRSYTPSKSICFIINYPKKREVFAANFRDRIVHHLYFNYTHKLFENTFICDNYSCIKGKGTHYGINRCKKHILKESENYTKDCYALKMDIKGYFMHIDRKLLNCIVKESLKKMSTHKISNTDKRKWIDLLDFDFLYYLTDILTLLDPTIGCIFKSKRSEWDDLPKSKSLFYSGEGFGLPIGNLTSQLFSNIYLNVLDNYVKRELKCKHYGRYVDDFYIISKNKNFIRQLIPKIELFLKEALHLEVNKGKTKIINIKYGVEFLGAFIKQNRVYISNESLRRIKKRMFDSHNNCYKNFKSDILCSINSYCGAFFHYNSFNIRKEIFDKMHNLSNYGYFNEDYTKFLKY